MTDFPPPKDRGEEPPPSPLDDAPTAPERPTAADTTPPFAAAPTTGEPGNTPTSETTTSEPTTGRSDAHEPLQDDWPHAGGPSSSPPPPTAPLPPAPTGGYQGAPMRRLYRSSHDRKLGGVSAGIAEFFGLDPTIVRLLVALSFLTGVGVLAYLAAWFIVPARPDGIVEPPRPRSPLNERQATVAIGVAAIAMAIGISTGSWVWLAFALIGGGVWLLSEQTVTVAQPAQSPGAVTYDSPGASNAPTPHPLGGVQPANLAAAASPPPPAWQPSEARPPRKSQKVTWTVLSLLALLAALGIAASTGGWWDVSATRLLGVGIVITGIGVVVGVVRGGGARGLIPLGILGALALFPVSAVDGLLDDGFGDRFYQPTTIEELESSYQLGVGELTVDLSELDLTGVNRSVNIDLGVGDLTVIVPRTVGGTAELDAKAGEISYQVAGTRRSMRFDEGLNVENRVVLEGDTGTLELDMHVGLGVAQLRLADD